MVVDVTALMEAARNDSFISVSLNGKSYNAKLDLKKGCNEDLVKNLKSTVKLISSKSLYDYLYEYHKKMFDDINDYEDGSISSGSDLMKSLHDIDLVTIDNDTVYVSGQCDWDDEHGFSIAFPSGKFVKNSTMDGNHKNDYDKSNHYQPRYTVLSGHRSAY